MALVGVFCVALLVLTTIIHYEVLRMLTIGLPAFGIPARAKLIVVIFGAFFAHVAEIVLYAVAIYVLVRYAGTGTLGDASRFSLTQCLYFSAETYSSLGYGDVVPGGDLRLLAGVEVLNGLLLIGWSASYTLHRDGALLERCWRGKCDSDGPTGRCSGRVATGAPLRLRPTLRSSGQSPASRCLLLSFVRLIIGTIRRRLAAGGVYAKANPRKINFAHGGPGSSGHFATEMFLDAAGIEATLIPYKGAAPALNDVLGRQVDLLFLAASAKPHIDAGRAIAIRTAGVNRTRPFLDVPTLIEQGVKVSPSTWYGVIAPGGTPPEVVAKLNNAFNAAIRSPEIVKRMETDGYVPNINLSPAEFAAFIQREMGSFAPIVRKAGIKIQ